MQQFLNVLLAKTSTQTTFFHMTFLIMSKKSFFKISSYFTSYYISISNYKLHSGKVQDSGF